MLHLPRHFVHLFKTGGGLYSGNQRTVRLAHDLYSGSLCPLFAESTMDLRPFHANHQKLVCVRRGGTHRVERAVRLERAK